MATVKTYDSKCYELAEAFLSDEPDLNTEAGRHALATEIQQCIEDEIEFMRRGASYEFDKAKLEAKHGI